MPIPVLRVLFSHFNQSGERQEFVRKDKRFQHKDKGPYSNGNDLVPKPFKKKLALGEVFCYGVKISKFVV